MRGITVLKNLTFKIWDTADFLPYNFRLFSFLKQKLFNIIMTIVVHFVHILNETGSLVPQWVKRWPAGLT